MKTTQRVSDDGRTLAGWEHVASFESLPRTSEECRAIKVSRMIVDI